MLENLSSTPKQHMMLKLHETIKSPLKSDVQEPKPKARSFKPWHSAMSNNNLILNMDVIYLHLTARHTYGRPYWYKVNIRGKFKEHLSFVPQKEIPELEDTLSGLENEYINLV